MKTSKVKNVQGNGTYESQYGLLYKFDYELEDGTSLTANHKSQNPFPIGTEVEYEIKGTNDFGSYGKVSKPSQQFNGSTQKKTGNQQASFALSYAKDLCVGQVIKTDEILKWATRFNHWLENPSSHE